MNRSVRTLAAAGGVVLALTLSACGGSSDEPAKKAEPTKSSASPSPSATAAALTVPDYIKQVGATEKVLTRDDSDGVTVDLPVPDGWETSTDYGDAASFGAIVYQGAADPSDPPRVLSLFSRLDGDVDADKILEYAPQELKNLDGFKELSPERRSTLGTYDAVEYGGTYDADGRTLLVAQKTVVLPASSGGVYVLQLNAYAPEDEIDVLTAVMNQIDTETSIS